MNRTLELLEKVVAALETITEKHNDSAYADLIKEAKSVIDEENGIFVHYIDGKPYYAIRVDDLRDKRSNAPILMHGDGIVGRLSK